MQYGKKTVPEVFCSEPWLILQRLGKYLPFEAFIMPAHILERSEGE